MVTNGNGNGHHDEVDYFDAVRVVPPSEWRVVDLITGDGGEKFIRMCTSGESVREYMAIYCNHADIVAAAEAYINARQAIREVEIIDSEGKAATRRIGVKAYEEAFCFMQELLASTTFTLKVKKQKSGDVPTLMAQKAPKEELDGILTVANVLRPDQTAFSLPFGGAWWRIIAEGRAMLVVSLASDKNPLLIGHVGKQDKFLGGVRITSEIQKLTPADADILKEVLVS